MSTVDIKTTASTSSVTHGWGQPDRRTYQLHVVLTREQDGRFSAYAASLPGVASQGTDESETLANIAEAAEVAIEVYKDEGREIPWLDKPVKPESPDAKHRWILVHG